jgi:hypothetical protein
MLSQTVRAHPRWSIVVLVVAIIVIAIGAYAYALLEEAGELPWQADPTRISEGIVPFSGLFDTPTATATETP